MNTENEKDNQKCECCGAELPYIYLVKTVYGTYCHQCVDTIMETCEGYYL